MFNRIRKAIKVLQGPHKMSRGICPVCGRDVAITKNGFTFSHRVRPGSTTMGYHTVRMKDGVEV
jgi:hypothetical protein